MATDTKRGVLTHIERCGSGEWTKLSVSVGGHTIWIRDVWLRNFADDDAYQRKIKRLTVIMDTVANRYHEQFSA